MEGLFDFAAVVQISGLLDTGKEGECGLGGGAVEIYMLAAFVDSAWCYKCD